MNRAIALHEIARLRTLGDSTVERLRRSAALAAARGRAEAVATAVARTWRRARVVVTIVAVLLAVAWIESRTSIVESGVFSALNSRLHYAVGPDASGSIAFPGDGPLDARRGYDRIPAFASAMKRRGFAIREQSRFSSELLFLARLGIPPPFRAKTAAGLVIQDHAGATLFDSSNRPHRLADLDALPPIVARSLLYIENRQLQTHQAPTHNPAIDWPRFAKAWALWTGRRLGLPVRMEGGSTLAVQLEKYEHTGGGRTNSAGDKLRQIAAASLAAYRSGPDTGEERRQLLLDYLNTVPLAATPEHGEVTGISDGLSVWFGVDPDDTWRALSAEQPLAERAAAYKRVLALLCAVQAPSRFLRVDHAALERRVDGYTRVFERAGVIDAELARATRDAPLEFAAPPPPSTPRLDPDEKSAYAIRSGLSRWLGVPSFYALDRLDVRVRTTLDDSLQGRALALFRELGDSSFVAAHGLRGEHLLASGDPSRIQYSLLLFESSPGGDRECAHVDNLEGPFDLNTSMKLELGSTAKLRALAHYLGVIDSLHGAWADLAPDSLETLARVARDPITQWTASTLAQQPGIDADTLLAASLERTYSANPGETFFTGGGQHTFHNFDRDDNGRVLTLHEALVHSTNLVFVRLLRDLERFHAARLPYDPDRVLADPDDPDRRRLLAMAAEDEARTLLWRSYQRTRALSPDSVERIAMGHTPTARRATVLFYAWSPDTSRAALAAWLAPRFPDLTPDDVAALARNYGKPEFTLLDDAYLAGMNPLELWCLGEHVRAPSAPWDSVWTASEAPRRLCQAWLFDPRRARAQNLRLKPEIEREAFERMTPYWQALGFPFRTLVPSLATALGASGDRPLALARLMGIIVADGVSREGVGVDEVVFGSGTPYHTVLTADPQPEQRVMSAAVARTLRRSLAEVVERGTAQRLSHTFVRADGTALPMGGKTGSGDNRFHVYARGGALVGDRATSRTAAFVFYLGDHYGVITASVQGPRAGGYVFTSALPLAVLDLLAPAIEAHLAAHGIPMQELARDAGVNRGLQARALPARSDAERN